MKNTKERQATTSQKERPLYPLTQPAPQHPKCKKRGCAASKQGWQRHTLPHRLQCSTIRAHGLNDRVRHETGWTPAALATNLIQCQHNPSPYKYNTTQQTHNINTNAITNTTRKTNKPATPHHIQPKPSTISTGQLHTLLRLHTPPIQLVVSQRSYLVIPMGNLVSGQASHLDAFSGYPFRR